MTQSNSTTVALIIICISMLLGLIILGVCLLKNWVNARDEDVESLVREKYTIRRKNRHHRRPKSKKRMYNQRQDNDTDLSPKFYFSYKPKAASNQFMADDDDKPDVLNSSNESEYFNRLKLADEEDDNQVVDWGRKTSHKKYSNDDAVKRQRESSGRGREKRFSSRKFRKEYKRCRPRTVEKRSREERRQERQVNESNVVTLFYQRSDSDPSSPKLICD